MIKILDLKYLQTTTEVSNIYGGNRRTFNRGSANPTSNSFAQFINSRQNAVAVVNNSIGGTAIAINISIINIRNINLS